MVIAKMLFNKILLYYLTVVTNCVFETINILIYSPYRKRCIVIYGHCVIEHLISLK